MLFTAYFCGSLTGMATGGSRAEQKRHTRSLIVAAGREAVAARGFGGLVVREIARDVGIVPTAFYRHFASLEELSAELAAGSAGLLAELVDALVVEPVATWAGRAAESGAEHPQTWSVLARGLVDVGSADHAVLTDAVAVARRRVGIALGREERLSRADGSTVDVVADLVVVELLRVLVEVASGRAATAVVAEADLRLGVVLSGAG